MKTEAQVLVAEALVLAEIVGMEQETQAREDQAARLKMQAKELQSKARLEDLTVRQEPLVKRTKKGWKRNYFRWVASWREGKRYRKVYLGSCRKLSREAALVKARRMKAEALGIGIESDESEERIA